MNTTAAFAERGSKEDIESGSAFAPKFDEKGLIPAIDTDFATGEVLMQAWMNAEALAKTIEIGEAVYWSRSRKELWHKGATSGHTQVVKELRTDCDQDSIWLRVEQKGGAACHVGYRSCFYRRVPVGEEAKSAGTDLVKTEQEKAYDPEAVYGKKSS